MTTDPATPASTPPALPEATRAGHDTGWRSLPPEARLLCVLGPLPLWAMLGLAAGFGLGLLLASRAAPWWLLAGTLSGLLLGGGLGLYRGAVHYASTRWRLNDDGLSLRQGRMWQREVRVPASRVQHLDLQRGPLQRSRGLATLVVHTAGTAHAAVSVANLALADAEALREALARPERLDPTVDPAA